MGRATAGTTRWPMKRDGHSDRQTARRASEASQTVLNVWRSHSGRSFDPSPALTGHSSLRLTRYHSHHFNGLRRSALCHGSPSGEESRKHRVSPPGRTGGDSGEVDQPRGRFLACERRPWAVRRSAIGSHAWHVGVVAFRTCPLPRRHVSSPLHSAEGIAPDERSASRRPVSPRDAARPRLNKEKRVCLRGSTLVNPTARDLNKSAILRSTSSVPPPPLARLIAVDTSRPLSGPVADRQVGDRDRDRFYDSLRSRTTILTKRRRLRFNRAFHRSEDSSSVSEIKEASPLPPFFPALFPSREFSSFIVRMESCTMGYL